MPVILVLPRHISHACHPGPVMPYRPCLLFWPLPRGSATARQPPNSRHNLKKNAVGQCRGCRSVAPRLNQLLFWPEPAGSCVLTPLVACCEAGGSFFFVGVRTIMPEMNESVRIELAAEIACHKHLSHPHSPRCRAASIPCVARQPAGCVPPSC